MAMAMATRWAEFRRDARSLAAGTVLVLAASLGGVQAQVQGGAQAPVPPDSEDQGPAPSLPRDPGAGPTAPPATSGSSNDLARSGGVIKPPANVDPDMKQPTPRTGAQSMPVIPPPGTPGGNPDIIPK